MRITDSLIASGLQQNIQTSLSALNTVTSQISTGKSLTQPSDNPTGTAEDLSVREALLGNTQYESDANGASSFLSASGGALSNVNTLLDSVNQIAVQGANGGALSQESLNSLANQVDSAVQQLTQIANTSVAGKYVFGGTQTQAPPYTGTPPVYGGNEGAVTATIGPGVSVTLNSPGANQSLFTDTFSTLEALKSHLAAGDSAAVSSDITAIQQRISVTSAASADIGNKTNQVTAAKQNLQRLDTEYQDTQSNIENTDLAQAYVQLQSAQNTYQASLVVVSKAYQYTLATYLG